MRRYQIAVLFSFLCFCNLSSAEEVHMMCGNSVSSLKFWSEKDKVYFRLDDVIGFKNFPIYDGVVTPSMAPLILRGLEELKAFDKLVLISWDRSQCKFDSKKPMLVECSGRAEILSPEKSELTSSGVSTQLEHVERIDLSYDVLKFNLGLDTKASNYTHYFLAFPFSKTNCTTIYN